MVNLLYNYPLFIYANSTQGFSFLKFKVFIVSFEPFLLQEVEIFVSCCTGYKKNDLLSNLQDNYGAILEDEEYFVINNSGASQITIIIIIYN